MQYTFQIRKKTRLKSLVLIILRIIQFMKIMGGKCRFIFEHLHIISPLFNAMYFPNQKKTPLKPLVLIILRIIQFMKIL